jgi:oxygen-dependent protoporphyrinogen oxidase
MSVLVDALARGLRQRGADLRTRVAAERLGRGGGAWVVETSSGPLEADGVVLAVPAPAAASLLEPHAPDAAGLTRTVEYASVAVVTLAYRREALRLPAGTGFLVPRGTPSPVGNTGDEDLLLTAGTFLDAKWPHLRRDDTVLLRASAGRFGDRRPERLDDRQLADRLSAELAAILGLVDPPLATLVTRWPRAFPQYRVGHLLRVSGIESAVRRLPAIALAGAAYHGVGIPACVASGRAAARSVLESIGVGPPARP